MARAIRTVGVEGQTSAPPPGRGRPLERVTIGSRSLNVARGTYLSGAIDEPRNNGEFGVVGSRQVWDGGDRTAMPAKKKTRNQSLTGAGLVKETCRRIRAARSLWDAHNNRSCRGERAKALALYESLNDAQREQVPQALRVWLRYRSEKYFGGDRTPPSRGGKPS